MFIDFLIKLWGRLDQMGTSQLGIWIIYTVPCSIYSKYSLQGTEVSDINQLILARACQLVCWAFTVALYVGSASFWFFSGLGAFTTRWMGRNNITKQLVPDIFGCQEVNCSLVSITWKLYQPTSSKSIPTRAHGMDTTSKFSMCWCLGAGPAGWCYLKAISWGQPVAQK